MPILTKCKSCNPDAGNFQFLSLYLPGSEYEYKVCSFSGDGSKFKTRLRTTGKTQGYAQKWLEDFNLYSKCTMRIDRTYPHSGTKNVFKVDLRCQHNTKPRSERVKEREFCKNTDCPAKMGITVKRVITERKSRSKDPHLPSFPTVIQMDFCHNHAISTPEILKHRSVIPEVKEKICALYRLGHSPHTALDMHRYDLMLEHGDNFEKICHDRAILPDTQFCYRLYYNIVRKQSTVGINENPAPNPPLNITINAERKSPVPLSSCENSTALNLSQNESSETVQAPQDLTTPKKPRKKRKLESGTIGADDMAVQLEQLLLDFCESGGLAGMQRIEGDTCLALATPLMNRVHSLVKQSSNLVFVDAYGEIDQPNSCRVLLLVTYSCIGAMPLGCLITTSSSSQCLSVALDHWKQILPTGRFCGRSEGPDFFFTNANDAERQSFKAAFPKSQRLICLSHILQSAWSFVWDKKSPVKKEHRSQLFAKIKMILFAQTVEELEMNHGLVSGDPLVKSYAQVADYIKHLYDHRYDWSLVYRRHIVPRAADASFFWETAMIVLKDPILSRSRSFNPLQIIDFLSRLDTYYEKRLIDLANSRFDSLRLSRFLFIELPREAYTITQNSENEYEVHNDTKDTTYQVDITLGMCECRTGKNGAPCKHQLLIYRNFPIPVYDCIPPGTQSERILLFQLATGEELDCTDEPESIPKVSQRTVSEPTSSDITIHDLDASPGFFINESSPCDTLTHATAAAIQGDHSLILTGASLVQVALEQHQPLLHSQDVGLLPLEHSHQPIIIDQHLVQHQAPTAVAHMSVCDTHANEQQSVTGLITQICETLKQRTSGQPSVFQPALATFLKNMDKLPADSALEHALYSFGKFSKSLAPMFKRKIVDNKLVGLQSVKKKKQISKSGHSSKKQSL